MIYVAIGLLLLVLAAGTVAGHVRKAALAHERLVVLLGDVLAQLTAGGAGTDPALLERLEAVERRAEAIAADAVKQYRKTAQERRRIEAATGIDDDDDDETPGALDQLRLAVGQPGPTTGRRKLRRPNGR